MDFECWRLLSICRMKTDADADGCFAQLRDLLSTHPAQWGERRRPFSRTRRAVLNFARHDGTERSPVVLRAEPPLLELRRDLILLDRFRWSSNPRPATRTRVTSDFHSPATDRADSSRVLHQWLIPQTDVTIVPARAACHFTSLLPNPSAPHLTSFLSPPRERM